MLSEIIRTYKEINEKVGDIVYGIKERVYEALVPEMDYGFCYARILPDKGGEHDGGTGKHSKIKGRGKDKKTKRSDFVKRNSGPKDRNKQR